MNKFLFLLFIPFLWMGGWETPVWAQETFSAPTTTVIETHWDGWKGMQYLQNGKTLTGAELKNLIDSSGDPQISDLLAQSESNENWGYIGMGTSLAMSLGCLFIPDSVIQVGGLKVSLPYLPVQIPALLLGVASSFLENAAGADKYTAVQRYNREVRDPGPVTWDISPGPQGLMLDLNYAL